MNYYNEIKQELINNEVYKKVKDISKNRSDLTAYYNVGKLLSEAGKNYGEGIIKKYSQKLTIELGKKYNERTLRRFRQFYDLINIGKWSTLSTELTWSHYSELLSLKNINEINYYIKIAEDRNLSVRELRQRIKSNEYERLDDKTKGKLINNDNKNNVEDFIKNPILIKNKFNTTDISEKMLKELILENMDNFLPELGARFAYVGNEYKIKIGNSYNYIDLLLYNIRYKCYVVIELKTTPLKKEHIGQIQTYMNYVDKNIKSVDESKTIGIIICKKNNEFILEYCSDKRILSKEYQLVQ